MTEKSKTSQENGFSLSLYRGPFQNNGASPWYSLLPLGTPISGSSEQVLKFCFDTGSDFIWVTSTLCGDGCVHYGGLQFDYSASSTFSWVDQTEQTVDFGPWGSMQVETGNDVFTLNTTSEEQITLSTDIYLSKYYSGTQFAELDWDGGIGIPSTMEAQSAQKKTAMRSVSYRGRPYGGQTTATGASFHFFNSLIANGSVNANAPYVCFDTDNVTNTGTVSFGVLDQSYKDSLEYLFLPWEPYPVIDIPYLWTSSLSSVQIDGESLPYLGDNLYFGLDSGSSQFKGDALLMTELFRLTTATKQDVELNIDLAQQGIVGQLIIPASVYDVEIEAGEDKGEVISQFQELDGVEGLVLVGSVLMDYLYTVYEYQMTSEGILKPLGMWIFNKPGGEKIIQNKQTSPAQIFTVDDSK